MEDGKDSKVGLSINDLIEEMFTTPGERVTPGRRRHIESQKLFVEEVLDKALHAVKSGKGVDDINLQKMMLLSDGHSGRNMPENFP